MHAVYRNSHNDVITMLMRWDEPTILLLSTPEGTIVKLEFITFIEQYLPKKTELVPSKGDSDFLNITA